MRFRYTRHAMERAVEKLISPAEIEAVLDQGTVIEAREPGQYDAPQRSWVMVGEPEGRPVAVVIGNGGLRGGQPVTSVITVYEASAKQMELAQQMRERQAVAA